MPRCRALGHSAVAYALSDSPLGQAAWIYSLFEDVADCNGDPTSVFSMDEMLDDIMLYWLPNASASSARLYWDSMSAMMSGPPPFYPSTMPTASACFPRNRYVFRSAGPRRASRSSSTTSRRPQAATLQHWNSHKSS